MSMYDIIFYFFALLTIISGYLVVSTKNIVHSGFYLLFTFLGVSGIYVLLGADFVAVVQIIVYVGGILILLLFGVMLTNKVTDVQLRSGVTNILPAAIGVGIFAGALWSTVLNTNWKNFPNEISKTTAYDLGRMLISDYVLIFELLGILLLVALIGAASIARKDNN